MASRIRDAKHIFECFLEVVQPPVSSKGDGEQGVPWILQTYPPSYKEKEAERLKAVPPFVFPCNLEIETVQNFSFVMTNMSAQWTFGFCRHAPNSQTALVIISSLPWHEAFCRLLNHAAELTLSEDDGELWRFLEKCYNARVPNPGSSFDVSWTFNLNGQEEQKNFSCKIPAEGRLPSIPENRNLTEYYNAVGIHNMLVIFSSMLYERRIIITSKKLSRLSACVQAANAIIYPMNWQHIFIPVLPKHLIEYLSAPMPFLVGVPAPIMERVKSQELGEAVILNADTNVIKSPFPDLESLPVEVTANLKRSLKNHKDLLGESVARAFLQALVHLIGGYRDALKFRQGEKITFSEEAFLLSRSSSLRPFLEQMLELQIFRQFIEERLTMLNTGKGFSDEFENEAVRFQERWNQNDGRLFKAQYAQLSSSVRKESSALAKAVKNRTNPAMKNAVKSVKSGSRGFQHKSKSAYREMKSKMKSTNSSSHLSEDLGFGQGRLASSSSAPSSPVLASRRNMSVSSNSSNSSAANSSVSQPSNSMTLANFGRNNTDLNFGRVLKYERFDPPTLSGVIVKSSEQNQLSPGIEGPKPLDLDLMTDLQNVFQQQKQNYPGFGAPPINRHLKPYLRRKDATNTMLTTSSSQPNLLPATSSTYENLEEEEEDYNVSDSSEEEADDPFNTEHVDLKNQINDGTASPNSPLRPRREKKSSTELSRGPVPPSRPSKVAAINSSDNVQFPKSDFVPFSQPVIETTTPRKPSLGDLIKLDSQSIDDQEIVFDPLLEPETNVSKKGLMPQPPSTSTLPQITQMFSSPTDHIPLQRTTLAYPADSPTVNPFLLRNHQNGSHNVHSSQGNKPPVARSQLTKSSDDLLKDYGIDFNKLSTKNFSAVTNHDGGHHLSLASHSSTLLPQNTLSLIGTSTTFKDEDPFADLDPLKSFSLGDVNNVSKTARTNNNNNKTSSSSSTVPLAPPRVKKQGWTTFD